MPTTQVIEWGKRARKFLAALVGVAGQVLALGILRGEAERWTSTAIAVITAILVYGVPNGDTVVKQTASGGLVAGEAAPLPTGTPVEVTVTPTETGPRHLAKDEPPTSPEA